MFKDLLILKFLKHHCYRITIQLAIVYVIHQENKNQKMKVSYKSKSSVSKQHFAFNNHVNFNYAFLIVNEIW